MIFMLSALFGCFAAFDTSTAAPFAHSTNAMIHTITLAGFPSSSTTLGDLSVTMHSNVTRGSTTPNGDGIQQEFPATLLLCPNTSCGGTCQQVDLSVVPPEECLGAAVDFNSVAIVQPSNEGLPFGVFVGPPGCQSFAFVSAVNECFVIDSGPFGIFEIN